MQGNGVGQSLLGIVLGGLLIFVAVVFAFGWVGSGDLAKTSRPGSSTINTPA
jgi:hypothetical protein